MKPKEYIKKAVRTESTKDKKFKPKQVPVRLEHAIYGLVTEAGELMDQIKKAKFCGREFDLVNVVEEAGDIMWYLAVLCDELGVDFEEVWEKNIKKLATRYPEKYSHEKGLKRDLKKERKILEE